MNWVFLFWYLKIWVSTRVAPKVIMVNSLPKTQLNLGWFWTSVSYPPNTSEEQENDIQVVFLHKM